MSLEFEEEKFVNRDLYIERNKGFSLANFLVEKKIVSDSSKANIILLTASILIIVISFFIVHRVLSVGKPVNYSDLPFSEQMSLPADMRDFLDKNSN
jgi:hypothetical protein